MRHITNKSVWYLSHPVAPDDRFTFEQNMQHVLHMAKLCYEEGFRVYVPWHTLCLILPEDDGPNRAIGLEVDCELSKMTGLMIATGHKWSRGMTAELHAMGPEGIVINGVDKHDAHFCNLLRSIRHKIGTYERTASDLLASFAHEQVPY